MRTMPPNQSGWGDVLKMIREGTPKVAADVVRQLEGMHRRTQAGGPLSLLRPWEVWRGPPNAAEVDGAVLSLRSESTRPELLESGCRLVVVAIGTGGRWSDEAVNFIWQLATAKARESPPVLCPSRLLTALKTRFQV